MTDKQKRNLDELLAEHRWYQPREKRTDAKTAMRPLDGEVLK